MRSSSSQQHILRCNCITAAAIADAGWPASKTVVHLGMKDRSGWQGPQPARNYQAWPHQAVSLLPCMGPAGANCRMCFKRRRRWENLCKPTNAIQDLYLDRISPPPAKPPRPSLPTARPVHGIRQRPAQQPLQLRDSRIIQARHGSSVLGSAAVRTEQGCVAQVQGLGQ